MASLLRCLRSRRSASLHVLSMTSSHTERATLEDGTLDTSVVGKCLLALFVSIRLYDVAPLQWHLSQTFQIDKHNNKPACEGLRTINTFEPLGKAFIKTLWDRGQRQSDREWASGYIAHKSRVTPIMQRRIIKHRLRQAGESHCDSFYDAANAFRDLT